MGRIKEFEDKQALEKAMLLFWRKGYANTSLKDLLSEMDILNGSFYNCFGNKKNVFIRAVENYHSDSQIWREELFSSKDGFKTNLRKFFHLGFEKQNDKNCPKGCFLVNSISADLLEDSEIQNLLRKNLNDLEMFFADQIELAKSNNELDQSLDSYQTASIILTYLQGIMKRSVLEFSEAKFRKQTDSFLDSLGV